MVSLPAVRHPWRLNLDQHVAVDGGAEIAQVVNLAGVAPDRLAHLFLRPVDVAVDRFDLDLGLGQRYDHVGQIVAMQALALARFDRELPHAHVLVLEDHAIADRPEHQFLARLTLQHPLLRSNSRANAAPDRRCGRPSAGWRPQGHRLRAAEYAVS